jgi:DNA-binding NarL/FixJ family response regulator
VVVLTADIAAGQVSRLIDAGAEAYLTKPLDVSQFLRTVEHVLSATARVAA